jgi:predicted metal-dependent hydrolase
MLIYTSKNIEEANCSQHSVYNICKCFQHEESIEKPILTITVNHFTCIIAEWLISIKK